MAKNNLSRSEALNILGLSSEANLTEESIRRAFRDIARAVHTDTGGDRSISTDLVVSAKNLLISLLPPEKPKIADTIIDLADAFYGGTVIAESASYDEICSYCSGIGRRGDECHACSNYKPTILYPKSHCLYCNDTGYAELCEHCRGTGILRRELRQVVLTLPPKTGPGTLLQVRSDGKDYLARIWVKRDASARMERGILYLRPILHISSCITGCEVDVLGREIIRFPAMHFSSFRKGDVCLEPRIIFDDQEKKILTDAARTYHGSTR